MTRSLLRVACVALLTSALGLPPAAAQPVDRAGRSGAGGTNLQLGEPVPLSARGGGVLYDNGPLVNSPGTGADSTDESVVQVVTLGMNAMGFNADGASGAGASVADDFTVPAGGWTLDQVFVYGYETGAITASTFASAGLRIWDGAPDDTASTVVFGDLTASLIDSVAFSGIYRVADDTTLACSSGCVLRPIMAVALNVNTSLPAGTYWLEWTATGSLGLTGPWAPPITITGACETGDALASLDGGVTFSPMVDDRGTPDPADDCRQGLPFLLLGALGMAAEESAAPDAFALGVPQPNPARGVTSLALNVPELQHVRAEAFDLLGRRVAVLHDGPVAAGRPTTLSFDVRALPAGVYVVRVAGAQGVASRRVTVVH